MDTDKKAIEIITGRYGRGTPDQNQIVDSILGGKHAGERFDTYFHWYNLLHELGHGIMHFNADEHPTIWIQTSKAGESIYEMVEKDTYRP